MSSKNKDKHYYHFLDIYNINILVAVTKPQLKKMLKELPAMSDPTKKHERPAGATAAIIGTTDGIKSYHVAFWIDKKMCAKVKSNKHSKLAEICAHEATHGAGMIWRHIGADINHDTLRDDEPMAYLVGWLTELLVRCVLDEEKK